MESQMDKTNDWLLNHGTKKRDQLLNKLKAKEKYLGRKFSWIAAELSKVRNQSKRKEELKTLKQGKLDFKIAETKCLAMKYEYLKVKVDKGRIISGNKPTLSDEYTGACVSKESALDSKIYFGKLKVELQAIEDKIHSTKMEHKALMKEVEYQQADEDNSMC